MILFLFHQGNVPIIEDDMKTFILKFGYVNENTGLEILNEAQELQELFNIIKSNSEPVRVMGYLQGRYTGGNPNNNHFWFNPVEWLFEASVYVFFPQAEDLKFTRKVNNVSSSYYMSGIRIYNTTVEFQYKKV